MSFPEQSPTGPAYSQPPSTPVWLPPRRKGRGPFIALTVAVAVLLLAGIGLTAWLMTRPGPAASGTPAAAPTAAASPAPSPTNSPTPKATPAQLDERTACTTVVPLLDQTTDLLLADSKHQPWDRRQAEQLRGNLETLYAAAPFDMRSDIGSHLHAVSAVLDGSEYNTDGVIESGIALIKRCGKYVKP